MRAYRRVLPFPRPLFALALLASLLAPSRADASLTESEKTQVRSFIHDARLDTVARARSLLARPDVSSQEASQVLVEALRVRTFDDAAHRYVSELLFGPSSHASRAMLAAPVTKGLLEHADKLFSSFPIDAAQALENSDDGFDELLRIHRLLGDRIIAPREPSARLSNDALRSIADAYREHFDRRSTHFHLNRPASGRLLALRDLAALNLARAAEGVFSREEASRWLGMGPAAQSFFLRTGIVVDDAGRGPDIRVTEILRLAQAVPGSLSSVNLITIDKSPQRSVLPSQSTLAIRTALGAYAPRRDGLFPSIIEACAPEQALFEAAYASSLHRARTVLNGAPALARLAEKTIADAAPKGESAWLCTGIPNASLDTAGSPSANATTASALLACSAAMLLSDAPRTLDLAIMRSMSGRVEPLNQMLLGLRLLTSSTDGKSTAQIGIDHDGDVELRSIPIELDADHIRQFSLDGHSYQVERASDGSVTSIKRDGALPRLADLPFARVPLTEGDAWSVGARRWVRLGGKPKVGVLEDGRVIMEGSSSSANSAIYTDSPGPDQQVTAVFRIERGSAGLIVRGSTSDGGFTGGVLVVGCRDSSCAARLLHVVNGQETDIAPQKAVPTQGSSGFQVSLRLAGNQLTASVDDVTFQGQIAQPLPAGHAGIMVRAGGRTTTKDFAVTKTAPAQSKPAKKQKR